MNIINEMTCGTVETIVENITITGEIKVNKSGELHSISGGTIYEVVDAVAQKQYLGSFNVTRDNMTNKRNVSINVNDVTQVSTIATAIQHMITDIEVKYSK